MGETQKHYAELKLHHSVHTVCYHLHNILKQIKLIFGGKTQKGAIYDEVWETG